MKFSTTYQAKKVRKVEDRPTTQKLRELLESGESYCSIGRMYGVSDNAVHKWFKLANEAPVKICGESRHVVDALTGKLVRKEHNAIVAAKNHFANRENAAVYQIENGKLASLDIHTYNVLKQTMSIRAIAREYGCTHSSLTRKFARKIHTDKLLG